MLTALSPNAKIPETTPAGSSQTARPKLPDAVSVLGIGIGPFNLGLAALAEPLNLDWAFVDQSPHFAWHPGMLLPGCHLQTPHFADLVTFADPTSRFSFLNYLKCNGLLYRFCHRDNLYVLREQFDQYCRWVAKQLPCLHFGWQAINIRFDEPTQHYCTTLWNPAHSLRRHVMSQHLVLGTGTSPSMLPCLRALASKARGPVLHSSEYKHHRTSLLTKQQIAVIGSGQSAAEIVDDLLTSCQHLTPAQGPQITWLTQSARLTAMDVAKFSLEFTSPLSLSHFYRQDEVHKLDFLKHQYDLYKGINRNLLDRLYDLSYEDRLKGGERLHIHCQTRITDAANTGSQIALNGLQGLSPVNRRWQVDAVVAATGYQYREPAFLLGIGHKIARDNAGRFDVGADYRIDNTQSPNHPGHHQGRIYVQNAELHSHGFAAPDLTLGAYRNSRILNSLIGSDVYPDQVAESLQTYDDEPPSRMPQVKVSTGAVKAFQAEIVEASQHA